MTKNNYFCIANEKIIKSDKLSAKSKAVYYMLCSFRNKENKAYPKRKTIIGLLHMSKSALSESLQELSDAEHIKISKCRTDNRFANNVYTLTDGLSSVRVENNKDFFMAKKINDFSNSLQWCDYAVYALYAVFCSDDMLIRISDNEVMKKLKISEYALSSSKKRLAGAEIIQYSNDGYSLSDGIQRNGA